MDTKTTPEKPVRAGVFNSLLDADRAVSRLLESGFTKEEITVICSDEARESHFREFEHQDPAGTHAASAVTAGASVGAAVGGLTAIAVGAATGAVPLIIAGGAGVAAGTGLGTFLGAMLTRGEEKELSNYYDQAVTSGKIVVAVEVKGPHAFVRLPQAAKIIADAGADPVALREG